MSKIAIVYFSGYGHTVFAAEAVAAGAREAGAQVDVIRISEDGQIADADWSVLDAANAIVYGSPTYMGGPAWQFKRFADASSKAWFADKWIDKLAGGFTVSASTIGDKGETLNYFQTLANQHGQIWVSLGLKSANLMAHTPDDINWTGNFSALAAIKRGDSPADALAAGDEAAARHYGARIAKLAAKL
ncbi:MAG: flavodoxin family protein [Paracoccus sp. (in: a-proteobacteria)]|uniref:flavodoxin family protein n=1 Tax=Paracoccus sp. TaxID=267 RepID=UPI0026E0A4F9|nr:flavodoxin family protein [Paracoccus sp. (in: a-proteobacteria)]MDO5621334.1 flavodoxin family protein [Paracoccus sp. (in: a-proteobacteria)]